MTTSPPRVAILDDEVDMRVALGRLLTFRGFAAVEFETGGQLLSACARETFHCVILDLHMPGMDGFEVLESLRSRQDAPPVIVITGHDQRGNHERVTDLGASAYFSKPIDGPLLLGAIARFARQDDGVSSPAQTMALFPDPP